MDFNQETAVERGETEVMLQNSSKVEPYSRPEPGPRLDSASRLESVAELEEEDGHSGCKTGLLRGNAVLYSDGQSISSTIVQAAEFCGSRGCGALSR